MIFEKSKSDNLTLSIKNVFAILYFYSAGHKFAKNLIKNQFFQTVQAITTTEPKSEKPQFVRKIKTVQIDQSKYSFE